MFNLFKQGTPIRKKVKPQERAIWNAAAKVEGDIAKYFVKALKELQNQVNVNSLARNIVGAPIGEVYRKVNEKGIEVITTGLEDELNSGLSTGARLAAKDVGRAVVLDLNTPQVKNWMKSHLAELVDGIGEVSKQTIKQTLEQGILTGRHPTRIAQDIKRDLGLTPRSAEAVSRKWATLEAQGVPLKRVEQITNRYADKLLKHRAQVIAHTESMTAVNQGRQQLWEQLDSAGAFPFQVVKEWLTSQDEMVCEICGPMNEQRRKIDEEFNGPDGSSTMAPPIHPQCRCTSLIIERPRK